MTGVPETRSVPLARLLRRAVTIYPGLLQCVPAYLRLRFAILAGEDQGEARSKSRYVRERLDQPQMA
jgi:hypothetical protein